MKLAIIGTGKIVGDALGAMQPIREISVNAIFARPHSEEKGKYLAQQFGVPAVFTDYNMLLEQADIDTVYIGLINSAHYSYAKRALEKKKNVIIEKPFAGNLPETEDLLRTAKEQDRFVFEAITVLHNDVIEKMRVELPKLGKIRMMLANYSQYSSRYDSYLAGEVSHTFDPAYLGGALRDINVYNIHYAVSLFGEPNHTAYYPNRGYNGIDTSGTLIMQYDGFLAVCTGAKDSDSPCFVSIQGEKGYMKIDGKPNVAPNLTTVIADQSEKDLVRDAAGAVIRQTVSDSFIPAAVHHRMTREFQDFARIIDEKNYAAAEELMAETLAAMRVISSVGE